MANTNQDALRMVTRARSHLLLDFPLWGVSVLGMDLKEDDAVGTLATDGQSLFYCPAYILGLSHKALIFWLAHEAAHVWLLHHTRRCGRDLMQWNIAADYAINPLLVAAGVGELPPGALLDPAMFDSAEKNYKLLTDRAEENKRPDDGDGAGDDNGGGSADGCADPGDDAGGPGDGSAGGDDTDGGGDPGDGSGDDAGDGSTGGGGDSRDDTGADDTGAGGGGAPAPGAETYGGGGIMDAPGSDKSQTENAVKCQIVQAVQAAKSAGKMPGGMEKVLSRVLVPSIDWRDVVADWVGGAFPDDYSYSRPSNRSSGGFVLPGLYSEGMGKIVLAIDTSISVYSHLDTLEAFKGAIEKLRDAYQFEGVVLCCDTAVRAVFTFGRTGPIEFELMGGGGTDFVPVFEWVADNMAGQDIAGLTYFTDLECWSYPAMVPGFPVLWACFGDSWEDDIYRGAVPFGDVVGIDD